MITRPLDLAAKLRPEPRNFLPMFFVNVGALALFFLFFGSRFILAPGLAIDLPQLANPGAQPTTHTVTVVNAGQVFAGDGLRKMDDLREWLQKEAKTTPHPTLLIIASKTVSVDVPMTIAGMATSAGFAVQIAARETGATEAPPPPANAKTP